MPRDTRKHPEYLILGEILRPHGVRGELRMRIVTDYPERLHELKKLYLGKSTSDKNLETVRLKSVRFHKDYALLTLNGISDRNQADTLRGKMVMIGIEDAVPLEDGEYYLFELIGLRVVADGEEIGEITEVLQTGANDVYIVDGSRYGELLIPAHDETIINLDFDTETVTMTLPEGLLPSE